MSAKGRNKMANGNRKYSVLELFEMYWVVGIPTNDLPSPNSVNGVFPTRSRKDGKRVANGEVEAHELWEEYLSEFQIKLAQELKMMRLSDMKDASDR